MKVTKAQAQENRARVVATASTLFRERGYDGVGLAELMAAAGLTHGGFYKNFGSKADLMAEAAACGLRQSAEQWEQSGQLDVQAFVDRYLSREHRDGRGSGCTMAALAGDAARQAAPIKAEFADGIEGLLAAFAQGEGSAGPEQQAHARARTLNRVAQMVGAIVLSRACPDDSALADEILDAARAALIPSRREQTPAS